MPREEEDIYLSDTQAQARRRKGTHDDFIEEVNTEAKQEHEARNTADEAKTCKREPKSKEDSSRCVSALLASSFVA